MLQKGLKNSLLPTLKTEQVLSMMGTCVIGGTYTFKNWKAMDLCFIYIFEAIMLSMFSFLKNHLLTKGNILDKIFSLVFQVGVIVLIGGYVILNLMKSHSMDFFKPTVLYPIFFFGILHGVFFMQELFSEAWTYKKKVDMSIFVRIIVVFFFIQTTTKLHLTDSNRTLLVVFFLIQLSIEGWMVYQRAVRTRLYLKD